MLSVLPILFMRFLFHFLVLCFFLSLSFFLLDLVVLLHLVDNESFSVTLIINTSLRIKECLSVVGIQHFLKKVLSFFQVSVLNNLVSVVAEPEQEPSQSKKRDWDHSCNEEWFNINNWTLWLKISLGMLFLSFSSFQK